VTGALQPWSPFIAGTPFSLRATPGAVYLGGNFNRLNDDTRIFAGAVDPDTGTQVLDWDPVPRGSSNFAFSGNLMDLIVDRGRVWLGGDMFTVTGAARSGVAAVTSLATCPTDLNLDSRIGVADLRVVIGNLGAIDAGPLGGDVDRDGDVDVVDLRLVRQTFGTPCTGGFATN
ncbi:MAG: hypothetical protein AAGD86_09960, partial [Pseudomonadota bacterium]